MSDALKEEDEKPLDPAMERVRQKMVRLLAISLGVMMIGLMAVLGAIVYKMSGGRETARSGMSASGAVIAGSIALPKGAYLNSHSLSGDRISLDVTLRGGAREIEVFDMVSQKIVARFEVTAE
jgi:hypothetical protein